jgi:cellulose synthase/poly-beta-1,6-N-acetylglucosamine synthase-like glycosyltransferase
MAIKIILWFSIFMVFYIYIGYTLLLYILSKCYTKTSKEVVLPSDLPAVTLFVAAWNERDSVHDKVKNSLEIDYPSDKLTFLWVTDGSDDGTPYLLKQYPQITVLHESARNGKIGAMNRGMKFVTTPIVVFCDANTFLNKESIREIVTSFTDPEVGCVAGEKRIFCFEKDSASGSGEGFYWKIESFLKKTESNIGSTVGAAGELFAIRTALFQEVEPNTILDDFLISMRIAAKGYKVKYNPKAIATEMSSATITDELKRKIRIAAGGFQVIPRLKSILNPFSSFWLFFSFSSHKLLRWTVLPLAFLFALIANYIILFFDHSNFYSLLFLLQVLFYAATYIGYILQNKSIKSKVFFVPYYLTMMNYAIILGFFRHLAKQQHVNWARSTRAVAK